jgi:hypothetical protein
LLVEVIYRILSLFILRKQALLERSVWVVKI